MKKITPTIMSSVMGGSRASAIIGGIACAATLAWPIGTIIAGPTCAGMIFATIYD